MKQKDKYEKTKISRKKIKIQQFDNIKEQS